MEVGLVSNLFSDTDGVAKVHLLRYKFAEETELGMSAGPRELLQLTDCQDLNLLRVWRKCSLENRARPHQADWRLQGGSDLTEKDRLEDNDGLTYYCLNLRETRGGLSLS